MSGHFSKAVEFTLQWEGGYSNEQHDSGGETMFGVTKNNHPELWNDGPPTKDQAKQLYYRDYWNHRRVQAGSIEYLHTAVYLFDCAVNHGPVRAAQMLQKACNRTGKNITVDGWVGSKTRDAIFWTPPKKMINNFVLERVETYAGLVNHNRKLDKFLLGWINRAISIFDL